MQPILIHHNLIPDRFMWLWAKYATVFNPERHCVHAMRGKLSKRFSAASNPDMERTSPIALDEQPSGSFNAIYICGVARQGYSQKKNYPHNLHTAIWPEEGAVDEFEFEGWELRVEGGRFMRIPREDELAREYRDLPPEFTTCRIFRWAYQALDKG